MILNKLNKNFIINLLIVFLIFLLDRLSKTYVIYLDKKLNGIELLSSKFLNIQLLWNQGIAFGLFSFEKSHLYNLLTAIIFIIVILIVFMTINSSGIKKYALLMIFGGAIGNLYDRVLFKAVPDFIDFHVGNFHWFIFNFADVFICVGVFFMIFSEFVGNNKNKSEDEKY
tara:strand:+ start:209 stop:718 length:510 start_codon:yes stop_codon:yes gene_type:complete